MSKFAHLDARIYKTNPLAEKCILRNHWKKITHKLGGKFTMDFLQCVYREALEKLKAVAPRFQPSEIITDFEGAEQRALTNAFPNATLHGCIFHYAKVIQTCPTCYPALGDLARSADVREMSVYGHKVVATQDHKKALRHMGS